MTEDYGPVPVSRLKHESSSIFDALEAGRRVLISRSGKVVAAIEPASVERHALQLAGYAVTHPGADIDELSATSIGQGSPSRAVRAAEEGRSTLVTRNNKVFGVMNAPHTALSLAEVDASERALADFERTHPEATPAEFASLVAKLDEVNSDPAALAGPLDPEDIEGLFIDALQFKATTLVSIHRTEDAEKTLLRLIGRFESDANVQVQHRVASSMVTLAKLYSAEDRHQDALKLIDQAVARLEPI